MYKRKRKKYDSKRKDKREIERAFADNFLAMEEFYKHF